MTPTPRDADLLARIAVGDRAAFEAFYRRHAVWLTLRLPYRCADGTLVAHDRWAALLATALAVATRATVRLPGGARRLLPARR